jgi:SAM-dependent methyltransferase
MTTLPPERPHRPEQPGRHQQPSQRKHPDRTRQPIQRQQPDHTREPDQLPVALAELHKNRDAAESFGADAERYDRARPSYPMALIERIVATGRYRDPGRDEASPGRTSPGRNRGEGPRVLDVGCGTGIAARLFQVAGCQVLGVDPDERMADLARQRGLPVEVARFEDWDPAGRTFDTVVAGQAWHWIDAVAGAAKAAQALPRGGRLAVFWNAFTLPTSLTEASAAVLRQARPGAPPPDSRRSMTGPEAYAMMCARAADGMREAGGFGDPEQWRFDWDRSYTRDEWLDQISTSGFINQLPPGRVQEMLADLGAAIDAIGGTFTVQYATMVATATRT